ncbi:MAG: DUF624 domain-containing protein [Hespellia sp.]|nr:DUF624 domain-containing protein [Hespellia sp.]
MNWIDNKVINTLGKVIDLILLNMLWCVCSLPIITMGAATSALYAVMLKMVKNEEGYIYKDFFRALKENFRKSTEIWLIVLLIGIIAAVDFRILQMLRIGEGIKMIFYVGLVFIMIMTVCMSLYAFPMAARYENTVKNTMKNALILSIVQFKYTILMLAVTIIPMAVTCLSVKFMAIGMVIWFVAGVAVVVWINSCVLRKVFLAFEK